MPDDESQAQTFELIDNLGAVVLCGGKSTRLGMDKTRLVFQNQTFLQCVVEKVSLVARHVVLVGDIDIGQHSLSIPVTHERDRQSNCGPLEGIRVGLERLSQTVDYAFVTSCDVPLLNPSLIRFLFEQIGPHQAVVPIQGERVFGMTAVYQTRLHHAIADRIAANRRRVSELAEAFDALRIETEDLVKAGFNLDSMTNINSVDDYLELLGRFGLSCPPQIEAELNQGRS